MQSIRFNWSTVTTETIARVSSVAPCRRPPHRPALRAAAFLRRAGSTSRRRCARLLTRSRNRIPGHRLRRVGRQQVRHFIGGGVEPARVVLAAPRSPASGRASPAEQRVRPSSSRSCTLSSTVAIRRTASTLVRWPATGEGLAVLHRDADRLLAARASSSIRRIHRQGAGIDGD